MFIEPEDRNDLLHSEMGRFDFTPLEEKAATITRCARVTTSCGRFALAVTMMTRTCRDQTCRDQTCRGQTCRDHDDAMTAETSRPSHRVTVGLPFRRRD